MENRNTKDQQISVHVLIGHLPCISRHNELFEQLHQCLKGQGCTTYAVCHGWSRDKDYPAWKVFVTFQQPDDRGSARAEVEKLMRSLVHEEEIKRRRSAGAKAFEDLAFHRTRDTPWSYLRGIDWLMTAQEDPRLYSFKDPFDYPPVDQILVFNGVEYVLESVPGPKSAPGAKVSVRDAFANAERADRLFFCAAEKPLRQSLGRIHGIEVHMFGTELGFDTVSIH
ncbi:uncharacterized protein BDV17DRAFT_295437 [Aspergillus undulatus]|uniref:uncharacterized protein n=1 Tax=Aspergillus undulatus TaxID=1810928 RepID=UPI003CCCDFC3